MRVTIGKTCYDISFWGFNVSKPFGRTYRNSSEYRLSLFGIEFEVMHYAVAESSLFNIINRK